MNRLRVLMGGKGSLVNSLRCIFRFLASMGEVKSFIILLVLPLAVLFIGCSDSLLSNSVDANGKNQQEGQAGQNSGTSTVITVPGTVQASRFTHANVIKLTWTSVENSSGYQVYRSSSVSTGDDFSLIHSGSVNYFDDVLKTSEPPYAKRPYYYRVMTINGAEEPVQIGKVIVHGISSDSIDDSEPNDTLNDASEIALNQPVTAILYTLDQGEAEDRDYFKYAVEKESYLRIQIEIPNDSKLADIAMLRVVGVENPVFLSGGTTSMDISVTDNVVFAVEFIAAGSMDDIIGSYNVSITNLLED